MEGIREKLWKYLIDGNEYYYNWESWLQCDTLSLFIGTNELVTIWLTYISNTCQSYSGEYQANEEILIQYLKKVVEVYIKHIPRGENTKVDKLSKLA